MISKAYNPKARALTGSFPTWSAAYADPNSAANRLLNPLANAIEYLENINIDIQSDAILLRTDIHKHPHKRWLVDKRDVLDYDTTIYQNEQNYLSAVTTIIGTIGSTQIALQEVATEFDFYTPVMQTGWYVASSLEHLSSGIINSCAVINNKLYINMTEAADGSKDPGIIDEYTLPHSWVPNIYKDETLQYTSTFEDIVYQEIIKDVIITEFNQRITLDHQLQDQSQKLLVEDLFATLPDGTPTYTTDFQFLDTSEYTVRDVYVGDLDDDGIIDEREIDIINANMNKTRSDFTDTALFDKYDINGDGIINGSEITIIEAIINTIQNNVSAIVFTNPGKYRISYKIPANGLGASKAIYNRENSLTPVQSETYGYLPSIWPSGYIDAAWDQDKSLTYYLDNDTKSVWAYETDILGNTLDRYKIQLPLLSNLQLRGIYYSNYRIYVLSFSGTKPYIYTIRTDIDDFENYIEKIEIHSGNESTNLYTIERDGYGLSPNAIGLAMINNNKLVTIDNDQIKLLMPIYDYFYRSTDTNGILTLNFRENYDALTLTPSGQIYPIYQELWNAINIHGEEKGLPRIPGETNASYKARILDVFTHFPDRTKVGSLYGIQRELGLPIEELDLHETVHVLPSPITKENMDSVSIFDDNQKIEITEISIKNEYRYGKYSHDTITFLSSGVTLATINRDIIE